MIPNSVVLRVALQDLGRQGKSFGCVFFSGDLYDETDQFSWASPLSPPRLRLFSILCRGDRHLGLQLIHRLSVLLDLVELPQPSLFRLLGHARSWNAMLVRRRVASAEAATMIGLELSMSLTLAMVDCCFLLQAQRLLPLSKGGPDLGCTRAGSCLIRVPLALPGFYRSFVSSHVHMVTHSPLFITMVMTIL